MLLLPLFEARPNKVLKHIFGCPLMDADGGEREVGKGEIDGGEVEEGGECAS